MFCIGYTSPSFGDRVFHLSFGLHFIFGEGATCMMQPFCDWLHFGHNLIHTRLTSKPQPQHGLGMSTWAHKSLNKYGQMSTWRAGPRSFDEPNGDIACVCLCGGSGVGRDVFSVFTRPNLRCANSRELLFLCFGYRSPMCSMWTQSLVVNKPLGGGGSGNTPTNVRLNS